MYPKLPISATVQVFRIRKTLLSIEELVRPLLLALACWDSQRMCECSLLREGGKLLAVQAVLLLLSPRWFLYLGEFMGLLEALLPSAVMTPLVLTVERQEEISERATLLSCLRRL